MSSSFETVKLEALRLRDLGSSWGLDDKDIDEAIRRSLEQDLELPVEPRTCADASGVKKRTKCSTCFSWFLKLVLFFAVIFAINCIIAKYHTPYMIFITKQVNHLLYPLMRSITLLILPIHSVTSVSTMKAIGFWECIIDNPFHKTESPPCDHCSESPKFISHVVTADAQEFKDNYYGIGYPLIIMQVQGYYDAENTFQSLQDLYWMHRSIIEDDVCQVESTSGRITSLRQVFSSDGLSLEENVLWKSCYGDGMRELRKMYPRPFFISSEGALERFTLILNSQETKTMLVPRCQFSNVWLAQVTGQSEISIIPYGGCGDNCPSYTITLRIGNFCTAFKTCGNSE